MNSNLAPSSPDQDQDDTALVIEVKKFRLSPTAIRDLISYFWIAGVGFSANVGSRVFFSDVLGTSFTTSMVLAYATGMVVAFVLSKLFAFDSRNSGKTKREAVKFLLVSILAMAITITFAQIALVLNNYSIVQYPGYHQSVLDFLQAYNLGWVNRELASHLAGMVPGFFVNFIGHKLITFKSTGVWDRYTAARENLRASN